MDNFSETTSSRYDQYLDLKALSKYSSLSVRTLRDYLHDALNPMPSFRIKNKILVKKSEFDNWIGKYRYDINRLDTVVNEVINALDLP